MKSPNEFEAAFAARIKADGEHQVPVVLEFILERVTNVSMGTEIDNVNEFEEILCLDPSLSICERQDMAPPCRGGPRGETDPLPKSVDLPATRNRKY